jgi:periplasmic protein TonB
MTATTMKQPVTRAGRDFKPKSRFGPVGLAVMIGFHILLGYALISGLARKAVEVVKKPLDATIIQEVAVPPPPPPPPPPKVEKVRDVPKAPVPPPPAYVPPPDVPMPASTGPAITAVQSAEPVVAPPPAPEPAPPQAPVRAEVSIACPGYIRTLQGALAGVYEKVGIDATVKVTLRVRGDRIIDVQPVSGPKAYQRYVLDAVRRISCSATGASELLVPLDVTFKEE